MNVNKLETTSGDWSDARILLDDYVVERVLGEGGMGKVYLLKSRTTGMQFAVKRAKGLSDADRRNFLAELQTWIDLPEHPNLVPCRFFRTVGDEVLIFAEFVEGGSLKDWIDSGKLYEGGKAKALERILDTAIQFAWGLHCVHELGLVHQDVKPANVMMAPDAQVAVHGLKAMVSDYGLARARAAGGERYMPELGRSILVSSGGYTPAYCSPEQSAGRKLDRRTDVWSWGLSVLEMFQGGVTWQSGSVAAHALEAFLETNGEAEDIPAMPEDMAELLRACFREDPAQRWQRLEAVVQNLKGVYQVAVGTEYSRALGKIEHRTTPQVGASERRTRQGTSWTDPREWLKRALREEGRPPSEAAEIVERHGSSRRGQLVADVAAYDEAQRIYERLIKDGRKDLENDLANLCHQAAFVHETADDSSGALALYDQAIEIRERLVNINGPHDPEIAWLYMDKGVAVSDLGDNRAASSLYDRGITIIERLVNVEGRSDLANTLAGFYMNKATAMRDLGDNRIAITLFEKAIQIRERLVNVEGREALATDRADLANLYQNKGLAVINLGDIQTALLLYDEGIKITERLVNVEGHNEFAVDLAYLYMNKANAFQDLGENRASLPLYDQAIEIRERLVNVDGRCELAAELANLYSNKGLAARNLGENKTSLEMDNLAIDILERLVNKEGRRDLSNNLATLYLNKAIAVSAMGDEQTSATLYDQAIEIRERLVNVEGRCDLADGLASLYKSKAIAAMNSGDNFAAVPLLERAIEILERLVNVEDRSELSGDLARLTAFRGIAFIRLGDTDKGRFEAHAALAVLEEEVNRTGRADLKSALAWTVKQLEER